VPPLNLSAASDSAVKSDGLDRRVPMRDFKGCAMFVATLLVGSLNAEHLGQQF